MDLVGDERAQSIQVGAVLLFAILIVAFSSYQAFVVPNQNRQVEFNHYTDSQANMENIRNAVINSGQSGTVVSESFSLGTNYPSRLVASQPERTYGSLRASPIGANPNITIQGASENASTICGSGAAETRAVTYRPEYFYLDSAGNITYENTVVYTTGRQGGKAIQTEQQLIDNTTIQLYPLLGNYSESGGGVTSISFSGGTTGEATTGNFTLTLPTKLSVSQWNDILEDQLASNGGQIDSVESNASRDAVDISFIDGGYTIRCSPTGTRGNPSNEPTVDDGSGDGSGDSGNSEINPAGPNDVEIESISRGANSSTDIAVQFNNSANKDTNFTDARVPFYFNGQNSANKEVGDYDIRNTSTGTVFADNFVIADSSKSLTPEIVLPGNNTHTLVTFRFNQGTGNKDTPDDGDFFVISFRFSDGEKGTYFISVPKDAQGP